MLHRQTAQALEQAIARGLAYIVTQQLPGGGFTSFSTTDQHDFAGGNTYRTTFVPSVILGALAGIDGPQAVRVKEHIQAFLLKQKNAAWSFNYWDRKSAAAKQLPYPDDLDDTFCALSALATNDPKLFDGATMAEIAKLLLQCEVEPGGPYRTWLVDVDAPAEWHDVDLAANANVARFLRLQGVELPGLTAQLEDAIARGDVTSPYYPGPFAIGYFASFWYRGDHVSELIEQLEKAYAQSRFKSALRQAQICSTTMRLGHKMASLDVRITEILAAQQEDGAWPAAAFCIDPAKDGKPAYAGAAALSTALCIEALALYHAQQEQAPKPANIASKKVAGVYQKIIKRVEAKIAALPAEELRVAMTTTFRRLRQQDTDQQIILVPSLVADAAGVKVSQMVCDQLAEASLWGWMAYTVFDDFLDEDADAKLLPAAIASERQLLGILKNVLPENVAFQSEVDAILTRIDAANAWEVSQSRGAVSGGILTLSKLPDYADLWQLADRSLGHSIAGLGVLYAAGRTAKSPPMKAMRTFFKHYLIARQLNDDLHDWEEDLGRGQCNVVAAALLGVWERDTKQKVTKGINLTAEADRLRLLLWEQVAPDMCEQILLHVELARTALLDFSQTEHPSLGALIIKPERAAQEALAKREDTLKFIRGLSS